MGQAAETVKKSPFWTGAETERLVDMADRGLSNAEIAVALQRSEHAVACRLQRIGWHGSTRSFVQDSPRRTLDCMPNPFVRSRSEW